MRRRQCWPADLLEKLLWDCGGGTEGEVGMEGRRRGVRHLTYPVLLALGSPIFPSGCEGKLGVALESLQGLRDLT